MKRRFAFAAAFTGIALVIAGCGSSGSSSESTTTTNNAGGGSSAATGDGGGTITIGSAGFTENILLADIYADALSAKGVKVKKQLNIGERGVYWKALTDGGIDFIPEYTGSILVFLDSKATAKTPADVYTALQAALPSSVQALTYASAQDSDTITVTKATADKYNLKSIGDLAPVASKLTFGGPAQFQTRADGIPALKTVYGVTFGKFTPLGTTGSIVVTALKNGSIDAADIFSTDSSIAANNFVSLADPKSMFAAQNIVPIINKSKVTPTVTDTVNAVSAKLDTATLADLVAKVGTNDPDGVAKQWLQDQGLI
jgi:osmoprotectant transport system substrate-binding protein